MKFQHYCLFLLMLQALFLTSCVDPRMSGGGYSNNGVSFNTYSTLPRNYSGTAYYHQGRYYTGGQHQTGNYKYQGRTYTSRYYHNGQYYYGGQHQTFRENRDFQHGDFPAGNYTDGNYQSTGWMERQPF